MGTGEMAWFETRQVTPCTGHCCRRFILPWNPSWLMRKARAGSIRSADAKWVKARAHVFLGKLEGPHQNEATFQHRPTLEPPDLEPQLNYYYTCHWLTEDGRCSHYDERPDFCREFPNGGTCTTPGCTRRVVAVWVGGEDTKEQAEACLEEKVGR